MTFMVARSRVLLVAAFVTMGALEASARADEAEAASPSDPAAEARRRYNVGTQAYTSKRFVEAALNFEAAAFQRPHAVTLYTAALAWEQANQAERAADDFARALEVNGLSKQQASNARERLAAYEAMLGTLIVTAPEGTRVQLDSLTEVDTPARLHGTAGIHALAIRGAGRPVERRDVILDVGQTLKLDVEAPVAVTPSATSEVAGKPAPVVATPEAPPLRVVTVDTSHRGDLRRTLGFVSLGVGAATLAGAVVLGLQALDARDVYDAAPTRAGLDQAHALETWTTVAWVAGGAFVAGGIVLVLWPTPPDKAKPARDQDAALAILPTLGGAALRGAF